MIGISRFWSKLVGGGVLGIITYYGYGKKKLHASWTTNYTPTLKWDDNWDRRSVKSTVKPLKRSATHADENLYNKKIEIALPTATRHIILIRHGQYNLSGSNDSERTLTTLGEEQAKLTAARLKEFNWKNIKIVQSTLQRALETADIIHKEFPTVPLISCDLLQEGAPIPPEPPIGHWQPEAQFYQDGARIETAFRKYFYRAAASQKSDSYDILICHSNVIRYFICRVLQFPPEAWLRFSLTNCSISWIAIRPTGRVTVRSVGDCGHIPVNKVTVS